MKTLAERQQMYANYLKQQQEAIQYEKEHRITYGPFYGPNYQDNPSGPDYEPRYSEQGPAGPPPPSTKDIDDMVLQRRIAYEKSMSK